jgi:voltage-gated potassium channel
MARERERPMQERLAGWMKNREQRRGLRPRDAAVIIAIIWVASVVLFGVLERLVDPHSFPTVWLGMWWALETVTTVGYGDVVPATVAGKIIGSFLLLGGLAFLTVIIAMITGGFVARYQHQAFEAGEDPMARRFDEIQADIDSLRELLAAQRQESGGGHGPPPPG